MARPPCKASRIRTLRKLIMCAQQITSDYDRQADTFEEMNLKDSVLRGVKKYLGGEDPDALQQRLMVPLIDGKKLYLQAATSESIAVAFAVASLQKVDTANNKPQILILQPTREDVFAFYGLIEHIGQHSGVKSMALNSGWDISTEKQNLKETSPQIVIGMPARVQDLAAREVLNLSCVELCVADSVDEIMNTGQLGQLAELLDRLPEGVQMAFEAREGSSEVQSVLERYIGQNRVNISVESRMEDTPFMPKWQISSCNAAVV